MIYAQVADDGVEPRRKSSFVFEFGRALHDAQERFLRNVFRCLRAAQLPQRKVVHPHLVAPNEHREGVAISPLVAQHQHFVAWLGATGMLHVRSRS